MKSTRQRHRMPADRAPGCLTCGATFVHHAWCPNSARSASDARDLSRFKRLVRSLSGGERVTFAQSRLRAFWIGFTTAVALIGLMQDVLGKQRYISLVESYWIDSRWTLLPEIAIALIAVVWLFDRYSNRA